MNVKALADHWKSITSAILGTIALAAAAGNWLDGRIETHVRAATERNVIAINALKCAINETPILDCDVRAGLEGDD